METGRGKTANANKVVRRRQVALLVALVLGIGAGGAGTWMVSEMNPKKTPPVKAPRGEPTSDMTDVVNQSFDNKVQRSAIAEVQRLNKETQTEIKRLRTEMELVSRDLKGSQDRIRELEDQSQLLQTQLEAGKDFDSLSAEPLPGALASQEKPAPAGNVPPPTSFWPAGDGQAPAVPVMTPIQRPGVMDSQEFSLLDTGPKKPRFPWISSGNFAEAIAVEGADASASVTGDKNTTPMQLRLTGKAQVSNDEEFDLTGCFVTLGARGDVSSERAIVRSRPISCKLGDDDIDQKIASHVFFMGKNSTKGEVVTRNGQILLYAGGAGFLDGIGKGTEKASSTTVGVGTAASMNTGDIGQAGLGGGVSSAAKTLSDYYIKRVEQYHSVIPIGTGNEVMLVFRDGFQLETLEETRAKAATRKKQNQPSASSMSAAMPGNTPDMLKQLQDFRVGDTVDPTTGQVVTQ